MTPAHTHALIKDAEKALEEIKPHVWWGNHRSLQAAVARLEKLTTKEARK